MSFVHVVTKNRRTGHDPSTRRWPAYIVAKRYGPESLSADAGNCWKPCTD